MTADSKTFGTFSEIEVRGDEYLELAFSPSSRPVNERWRNNGLSADFLADYFGTFIPAELPESHHNQVKGAVAYIANELLENAMKFSDCERGKGISLSLNLSESDLRFTLINSISADRADSLETFLNEFTGMDASEFFVVQMERNIETGSESGLGFATMVTDHDAQLGWKIERPGDCTTLTTQVVIEI